MSVVATPDMRAITMLVRADGSVVFRIGRKALAAAHIGPRGDTKIVPAAEWYLSTDARLLLLQAASSALEVIRWIEDTGGKKNG